MMNKLRGWLDGKKSITAGAALIAVGIATLLGWAEPSAETVQAITTVLGGLAVVALRAGVAKAHSAVGTEGGRLATAVAAVAERVNEATSVGDATPTEEEGPDA